jgi:hypothetical protein
VRIRVDDPRLVEARKAAVRTLRSDGLVETRRRVRRPWVLGLTGFGVLLLVGALLLPSWAPAASALDSGVSSSASIPPWNPWTCNPNNLSPAALDIALGNSAHSRSAGAILTVTYEFKVVGYHASDRGTRVYLPLAKAVLPTTPSGELSASVPARNLTITNGSWSSASLLTASTTLLVKETFSTASAYLSTSKYAVMASAASGSLTLELRWHWSFTPAKGGLPDVAPWSVPSSNASSPFLPSIFYPAPFVGLVSATASPAAAGTNFTLELNGTVANTSFRVVLEYPNNGTEIQSIWENTTVRATLFNATVPLTYRNGGPVPAGNYLVHVHDVCEAIVHMQSVSITAGGGGAPARPGLAPPSRN